jgi:hypothetical protein
MYASEWIVWIIAAAVASFAAGLTVGSIVTASRWASRAKDGALIDHQGRFYEVRDRGNIRGRA